MTWFSQREHFDKAQLTLVHITDSHVFAEPNGEYFCVNTANNLAKTLACIKSIECDAIIFGGDLTQDHSEASYHLFAQLVQQASLSDKLFKVFSSTSEPAHKAQLLQLAGLVNDSRWHEPCALFCKAHPEFCQTVLSHFVYKPALDLISHQIALV